LRVRVLSYWLRRRKPERADQRVLGKDRSFPNTL
jgi:hypothetical protein